jgi:hypothetical protein
MSWQANINGLQIFSDVECDLLSLRIISPGFGDEIICFLTAVG